MSRIRVLGTADWDAPIATNQHYVVQNMVRLGHHVSFQESIGLRSPKPTLKDARRIVRRVVPKRTWTVAVTREIPANMQVYSPRVVPFHRGPLRQLNKWVLQRKRVFNGLGSDILWTYTPLTYGLEENSKRVIYHCVDLLGKFPGIDEAFVETEERRLAQAGAEAIASSEVVRQHLYEMGFGKVTYWPNVADLQVFSTKDEKSATRRKGRVIFSGNITENKIDFEILNLLVHEGVELVLVGPHAEGGGNVDRKLSELQDKGVLVLGAKQLEEVAHECLKSHVGIIPYAINQYTTGVSPLKTYEYAASGLPVVSTNLPGVMENTAGVWKELTAESFVDRVLDLLQEEPGARASALYDLAFEHSWERRAQEIQEMIDTTEGGGEQ